MPSPETTVSAVMPVHAGVAVVHLDEALESLLRQTRPLDEIVVVEDGPLPDGHLHVLDSAQSRHPRVVRVKLVTNQGAGVANQAGIEAATGAWIAKADADDISVDSRVAVQLGAVSASPVGLCGSAMLEFVEDRRQVTSLRSMPLTHDAIGRRLRWNNPVNHPTAFFRRDLALQSGGYPPWRNMQDYGLVARMYAAGTIMVNLGEPLVLFRSTPGVVGRRRSATVRALEVTLQRELRALGLVGPVRLRVNTVWRTMFRMLPARLVASVSRHVLARPLVGPGR